MSLNEGGEMIAINNDRSIREKEREEKDARLLFYTIKGTLSVLKRDLTN
jgi:hypothetical protein